MADPKIRLKRSSVEGKIPTPDQVPLGEIALNTYDGHLYASKNVGVGTTVIAINPFKVGTGTNTYNAYFTAGNVGIGSEIPTTKLDVDGTVTAAGFATATGTSSQFLKADGSVDSSTYITSADGGNAATLDGIDSSSFLRSDAADTKTSGNLTFSDGVSARFGDGEDLVIWHNAAHSYILHQGTGDLNIRNSNNDADVKIESDDGSGGSTSYFLADGSTGESILYHYGTAKLSTKSNGIDVTGHTETDTLNVSGVATATSFIKSSNSGGFLKADGTEDTNTYLTSYTETDPVVAAINGIVKSDGSTISAATAGTDYLTDISQDTTPQLGGNLDLNSNAINGTGNINITGNATFSGNVTIGGTLTYEDVTNVDSVGLITARTGVNIVGGGLTVTGISTFYNAIGVTGNITVSGTVDGRDVATDGTKLDGIEASADVTDATNVAAAGAVMESDTSTVNMSFVVDEDNMASDSATKVPTQQSVKAYVDANAGGGGISNVVEDTTPQLGGNLDVNAKNINFGDSASASDDRLNFGAGTDFSIYHDGSNSYIDVDPDATNQHLYIRNNVSSDQNGNIIIQAKSGENSINCNDDGSVQIYYDNVQKFVTTSTGFSVTGTGLGNWKTNDNGTISAGTGDDLKIYHDGTDSYIDVIPDGATNHLYIRNNIDNDLGGNIYLQAKAGEHSIICNDDSSVSLYFDNAVKFNTTLTGFTVNGTGLGNFKVNDNNYLTAGTGDDFQIYHDGTDTYLDNDTGHLYIRNASSNDNSNIYIQAVDGENSIICADDSSVYLYYDNALKLQTTSAGVTITGTLSVTTLAFSDNQKMVFGDDSDLQVYHGVVGAASSSFVDNITGHLYIRNAGANVNSNIYIQAVEGENSILCADDSSVYLYFDNALKIQTSSTGFTVSGTGLGNWKTNDSGTITAGTGDDFQIYHDGTHTYLDNDTGNIYIRNNVASDVSGDIYIQAKSGENSIRCLDDSSVSLYYDNTEKLTTTATGVTITGALSVTTLDFADSQKLRFGTGLDAEIYHDGSNTYFDNDTGTIFIRNNVASDVSGDILIQAKSGENSIRCLDDAGVQIYYDNVQKFTTTADGITVTGTGLGNWKVNDSAFITAGTGDDFQIYHNGSHTYLDNDTGNIYIRNNVASDVSGDIYIQAKSGENSIRCLDDAGVQIYYDNVQKFTTTTDGVTITGDCTATSFTGNVVGIASTALTVKTTAYSAVSTYYNVPFLSATSGNVSVYNDSGFRYNPVTNVISSTITNIELYSNPTANETTYLVFADGNTGSQQLETDAALTYNPSTDTITAGGFSTSGGTSSQFLKADGSVDSSTYLTSYTETDPVVAAINGIVKSNGTTISAATAGTDYLTPSGDGSALTGIPTEAFKTITVSGQSNVVADAAADTLTLVAGTNMTITTDASTDTITFASSGGGGGGLSNVVEDTTPQLGGTLETNGNLIQFGDSGSATDDRLQFGASQDLQIYHNGTANVIHSTVSGANLQLQQTGAGSVVVYGDSPKLDFNDVTGGTQIDFRLEANNGNFTISDISNSDTAIKYLQNAAVELYHDNVKKFETSSTGATLTGALVATSDIQTDGAFRAESSNSTERFQIEYNETTDSLDFSYFAS